MVRSGTKLPSKKKEVKGEAEGQFAVEQEGRKNSTGTRPATDTSIQASGLFHGQAARKKKFQPRSAQPFSHHSNFPLFLLFFTFQLLLLYIPFSLQVGWKSSQGK
jgi:hypothetical protein